MKGGSPAADEEAYNLEALWTAIRQARATLAVRRREVAAQEEVLERGRVALAQAGVYQEALVDALVDVLADRARVEWDPSLCMFVVRQKDGDVLHQVQYPDGAHDARGPAPAGAAHVGSSVQGQAGGPR